MSGAISAVSVAGATAAAAGASTAGIAGAALAANATAISIGSSLLGGLSALQSSRAASASAGYNAKVAANNAAISTQNANFAGAEGQQNVAAEGAKTRAAIAATLANQGASGVDVNTGSSVDVRESEAKLGMLNSLNIRSDAARRAYGFQTEAASDMAQSRLLRSQQSSDKISGYINAASTVLGGAAKASKYSDWLGGGGTTSPLTEGPWVQ